MKLEVTKFQDAVNDVLPKTSTLKNFSHQRMQATKSSNVVKFGKPYKNPELVIFFCTNNIFIDTRKNCSKETELLAGRPEDKIFLDLQDVESDGLAHWSALPSSDDIAFFGVEARTHVHRHVRMSLLEPVVFLYVMQVGTPHGNGARHLGGEAHAFQDTAADAYVTCKRALLVNVISFFRLFGSGKG